MSIKTKLQEDMKTHMRTQDKFRLGVVRFLLAAIKQREVDERIELDDIAVLSVIEKQLKQRRDSREQFEKAGRQDLVDKEQSEIDILQSYLPKQMSTQELTHLINDIVARTKAAGMQDMGKVMAALKTEAAGKTDLAAAANQVRQRLQSA